MTKNNFYLDSVFNEKIDYTKYTFNAYKIIYDLPEIKYSGNVSSELFEYVKQRKYFVLLAIYDENGRIYLERNIQENLYWSLPGGSILKNEDIHSSVRRISRQITEDGIYDISIGEIEPIAFVENKFVYNDHIYNHCGIAFAARLRNKKNIDSFSTQGSFVQLNDSELDNINRYANREVTKICLQRIKSFSTKFPEIEISTNEKTKWRYWFHQRFFKKIILPQFLRKKKIFLEKIEKEIGQAKSFIDVSCGDNDISYWLAQRHNFEYVIANDISWSQINTKQSDQKKILFTNHNAAYLPFRENSFDIAYCANTLHHIPTREEFGLLLDGCMRIAKKVIFVEIEKPKDSGIIPYLLNKYWYIGFLKDAGGSYFSKKAFKTLMNDHYSEKAIVTFSEFKNIQGRYFIAVVEKKITKNNHQDKFIEIEEKFILSDNSQIENQCHLNGYKLIESSNEVDTYFSDLDGEFIKNRTCLRLRKSDLKKELTFKGKSRAMSNLYAKVEHNARLADEEENNFSDILSSLGYFKYVIVDKQRKTFRKEENGLKKNISIDYLKNIGCFIEFEILANSADWSFRIDKLRHELEKMKTDFRTSDLPVADQPYRDYTANFIAEKNLTRQTLKCILFDFDGTIVPSEDIFYHSYRNIATELLGYTPSLEEYKKFELKKTGALYEYILSKMPKGVDLADEEKFMNAVYDHYRSSLESIRHNEKVIINLESVRKIKKLGLKIALVSSSKREFINQIIEYFNVQDLFDSIISREDVENQKPSAEAYEQALEKLNLNPVECLAVEDSERGINAAKSAGLNCVAVSGSSIFDNNELENMGVFVFETLAEIAMILVYA